MGRKESHKEWRRITSSGRNQDDSSVGTRDLGFVCASTKSGGHWFDLIYCMLPGNEPEVGILRDCLCSGCE